MDRLDLIPHTILACCVLHNICLREIEDEADMRDYIREGVEPNENNEPDPDVEVYNDRDEELAMAKRDYIAARL